MEDNLLKLDMLGHDDPTMIRMLQDITSVNPLAIPLDDKKTMSLFSGTESLGVQPREINSEVGTLGVPEFGTRFVREMLVDTKPTTFGQLVRISGLSHGTDVWTNNAKDLVNAGVVTLDEAICTRDDIMVYLMQKGLEAKEAFKIMEDVRKGKGLTEEEEKVLKENNIADWYIESCRKIKYMFPKAHAAAYVTMAFRIAWFKVYYPEAYYSSYFSIRADEFESDSMLYGAEKAYHRLSEIESLGNKATTKEKNVYSILEIVREMYARNIKFLPIDLYASHSKKFIVEEGGIRPPLGSISGLGQIAAEGIYNEAKQGKFMCIEEMQQRTGIGKASTEMLENAGCLIGMPKSNQMSLFG
jgi:DNA polymerase-3 subunit alpha (Gram-positive type)